MPHSIDISVTRVLDGHGLEGPEAQLCDFTVAEQNAAAEAQGVVPAAPSNYKPILGESVTYIVACVIINDKDEVLMIQEAKQMCAGKWYLPAGRMEKGENIIEAAAREVLEETGLDCVPTTLLAVECAGGSWFRFVLTANVVGGELKTPARADKESLQAKWVGNLAEINLRASDIVHLIDRAKAHLHRGHDKSWHPHIMPSPQPHEKNLLRLVVIIKRRSTNRVHVLLSEKTAMHFPTAEINPSKSVHSTLRKFLVEIFGADLPQHRPHGLLAVEHCNNTETVADGNCLTLLVAFRPPLEEVPIIGKCVWQEVSKELGDRLLERVASKNATLVLHVVR